MQSARYLPVVLKQVVRNRLRSGLTIGGVAVAMFLFCGIYAMQSGAESATAAGAAENTLVVYRKDRYCPYTSRMPQSHESRIAKIPGVVSVLPMKIVVNNCRTSLDVVTFRGIPEQAFEAQLAKDFNVLSGSVDDWMRRSDAAFLGESLARRRRLNVGDRFDAAGITVYVAGIFASDEPEHQNVGYCHLPFLQMAGGGSSGGWVTQFNVRVKDAAELGQVAKAIDAEFASDPDPTHTRSQQAFMAQAASDILEIIKFSRWVGWGCVIIVLALVANAIILAVQDRIREHAVLQTLGYRGSLVAGLIVTEGVVLSLAGGLVGSIAAYGLVRWTRLSLSVEGLSISSETSPMILAYGLLVAVVLGVLAGLFPAWQAARRSIVESLRAT